MAPQHPLEGEVLQRAGRRHHKSLQSIIPNRRQWSLRTPSSLITNPVDIATHDCPEDLRPAGKPGLRFRHPNLDSARLRFLMHSRLVNVKNGSTPTSPANTATPKSLGLPPPSAASRCATGLRCRAMPRWTPKCVSRSTRKSRTPLTRSSTAGRYQLRHRHVRRRHHRSRHRDSNRILPVSSMLHRLPRHLRRVHVRADSC